MSLPAPAHQPLTVPKLKSDMSSPLLWGLFVTLFLPLGLLFLEAILFDSSGVIPSLTIDPVFDPVAVDGSGEGEEETEEKEEEEVAGGGDIGYSFSRYCNSDINRTINRCFGFMEEVICQSDVEARNRCWLNRLAYIHDNLTDLPSSA